MHSKCHEMPFQQAKESFEKYCVMQEYDDKTEDEAESGDERGAPSSNSRRPRSRSHRSRSCAVKRELSAKTQQQGPALEPPAFACTVGGQTAPEDDIADILTQSMDLSEKGCNKGAGNIAVKNRERSH